MIRSGPPGAFFRALLIRAVALGDERGLLSQEAAQTDEDKRQDLGVILAATLTLLGLIIGFSFSMAMNSMICAKTSGKNQPDRHRILAGRPAACFRCG